jgi:carbon storage regulator CsrA
MLVLSRRPDEKIVFPTIPAVLKVISSQNGLVRLGIEAPKNVPVLREELYQTDRAAELTADKPADLSPKNARQELRNRVNALTLGLALLRMQLESNCSEAVRNTFDSLAEELTAVRVLAASVPAPRRAKQPQR